MRYSISFLAALAVAVSAHGVITEIQGANGVTMPGLSGMSKGLGVRASDTDMNSY